MTAATAYFLIARAHRDALSFLELTRGIMPGSKSMIFTERDSRETTPRSRPRASLAGSGRQIILFTEGNTSPLGAKTAASVVRYRTSEVAALLDSTQAGRNCQSLLGVGGNIPVVASLDDAPPADTLMIGIAPPGGRLPVEWCVVIEDALDRGMTVVSGLHDFLSEDLRLVSACRNGARIIDVRKNNERDVARREGLNESCLRIQTVGNDCSVGKMVVAIELSCGLKERGYDAKFLATGQTGIMVSGEGTPIDCVTADFISGAAERLILDNQHHEILVVEGQGSLTHPSFSGVTLGLLHGTAPDGTILCYEAGREATKGLPHIPLKPLSQLVALFVRIDY